MSIRIPWPDGILDAWKPSDDSFIAQRDAEWPHVEYVLKASDWVKKKYLKKHKEFFMTGNVEKTLTKEDEFMIHLAGNAGYTYFMLWYYPYNDPDAFRRIFDYSVETGNGDVVARGFLDDFSSAVEHFEPEYGLMGEREENIFRAIYPSCDFFDIRTFEHSRKKVNTGPYIGRVLRDIADAYNGIFFNEHFNRYHHGLHIWDYLEHYLEDKKITECKQNISKIYFYNTLMIIKTNGEFSSYCRKINKPIRLHDDYVQGVLSSIRARFENREFNDGLMWVWDNLETLCEEC
jgi:hypothetical protein